MMVDFIDKKRFFGKKMGVEAPGVAPKTSGTVRGKWVWYRSREEDKENIEQQRIQDYVAYQKASDSEKQKSLYLLKTGAIKFQQKEDYAVNNVRNRVEVANSGLLNFFLGEGSAVKNTIAYSTYYQEKNDFDYKYYIDENGYVKEELASLYVGKFDTPKGKGTEVYNKEKLQQLNFAPLRKAFVVCGLMGFNDFLGNYDNFAFIHDKLVITDTGVGSGNTGQHSTYVPAGKTNFYTDVIDDLNSLLNRKMHNDLIPLFKEHLTIEDVVKGIDELKVKGKEDLKKILDESFKPVPNPFKETDTRYADFIKYNHALQSHSAQLYETYCQRINSLVAFQKVLNKFYPDQPHKYHVPDLTTLQAIDKKLIEQYFHPKFYRIFADVNEKFFTLDQKNGLRSQDEEKLYLVMKEILNEFRQEEISGEQIEVLLDDASELEKEMNCKMENLQEFDKVVNDLQTFLPKKWKEIFNNADLNVKRSDPKILAMTKLANDIKEIKVVLNIGKCTLEQAKHSLKESVQNVIRVSNEEQEKTTFGKSHKIWGLTLQVTTSDLASALGKFLKSFTSKEALDKDELIDLPDSMPSSHIYKQEINKMKHTTDVEEEEEEEREQNHLG